MKTQGINLHKYLEEYILMLKIRNVLKAEKHGYVVPLNPKDKKFISGRIMLIGDAAGLVDPITAEGISNAIDSGRAAAGAIITGAFSQEKTMKIFIREMNKILSELKHAKILSLLVYNSPAIRSCVFKKYGKKTSEVLADVYMGERSYIGILKDPITYLKLVKTTISIKNPEQK